MNYQALARKWRPHSFNDMVGQEPILRMLANALTQQRIHHAYLFTGTRGVGKTTVARILAKCLNCETGITATPCENCHACRAIDAGQFLDLYEVDAASRTKVEDTRELLDNVLYPPTQGRYKIYLIDEVHMLSNHSFNALLKTLEEPPAHVKFLLATTDPKRLPITILSRCLQFHLKHITPEQIANRLQHICQAESLSYEVEALEKLAKAADGSMRDALSLLDQAIAYGHGGVNKNDVQTMLGSMAQDDLLPLLEALIAKNGNDLFAQVAHLAQHAPDFQQVLEELINLFHRIAIAQILPDTASDATISTLATHFTPEEIQLYYQIALLGRRDLAISPSKQQGFEMTMLRLFAFKLKTEGETEKPSNAPQKTAPTQPAEALKPAESIDNNEWRNLLPKLELSGMAYALASNCVLNKIRGNKVTLSLSTHHEAMLNPKLKERLTESLSRALNQPIQLEINITAEELATPSKQQHEENAKQLDAAKQNILKDPKIQQLLATYDATVDVEILK